MSGVLLRPFEYVDETPQKTFRKRASVLIVKTLYRNILAQLPLVHHRHSLAASFDNTDIMAYHQHRKVALFLQMLQ